MAQVICGQNVTMEWPTSNPSPVHVGFVIDYLTMGQNFLQLVRIVPVRASLHGSSLTHLSITAIMWS
jgi:hypothetical protein